MRYINPHDILTFDSWGYYGGFDVFLAKH